MMRGLRDGEWGLGHYGGLDVCEKFLSSGKERLFNIVPREIMLHT